MYLIIMVVVRMCVYPHLLFIDIDEYDSPFWSSFKIEAPFQSLQNDKDNRMSSVSVGSGNC